MYSHYESHIYNQPDELQQDQQEQEQKKPEQSNLKRALEDLRIREIPMSSFQLVRTVAEGADGIIKKGLINQEPVALKWFKRDVSPDFAELLRTVKQLREVASSNVDHELKPMLAGTDTTPKDLPVLADDALSSDEANRYCEQLLPSCFVNDGGQLFVGYKWVDRVDARQPTKEQYRKLVRWVNALHAVGFVHCDIAPRNVLFDGNLMLLLDYASCVRIGKINISLLPHDVSTRWMLDRKRARACDDLLGLISVGHDAKVIQHIDGRWKLPLMERTFHKEWQPDPRECNNEMRCMCVFCFPFALLGLMVSLCSQGEDDKGCFCCHKRREPVASTRFFEEESSSDLGAILS